MANGKMQTHAAGSEVNLDLLAELTVTDRLSLVLVSHDRGVVARLCDQVAVMRAGVGAASVEMSLDGGPFRPATWRVGADGKGLELTDEAAVAFLTGLYGRRELRLAVVRPLSVPFVLTFAVAGAEHGLALVAERGGWAAPALSEALH